MTDQIPEVVDTRAAARIVGLSPDHMIRLRSKGGGPEYMKYGRHCVRYSVASLRAWMETRLVTSTADASTKQPEPAAVVAIDKAKSRKRGSKAGGR